ncbi:S66 peptidase family protein [Pedobacter flavus]|uniref:LD-carboxypeptidase n=1 Tax=Pedobacter flavus TaxID=3113906 RepID=A0ABU7H2K1_9SPHI|nr:LD-carboxypeptidase [Pedobacter sp. VNH31]MEE1885385.1 LD-carboxypeptidase [Pedobacter sp. VNH31]
MNRKSFINIALPGCLALGLNISLPTWARNNTAETSSMVPPNLNAGDIIGITSPAGYISLEDVQPAVKQLEKWGYKVEIGQTIGKKHGTFGGTDFERMSDFQYMLDNDTIKAVLCARGGYGMVRIIDKLNFSKFSASPKWLIGFSDITTLHSHLFAVTGIPSIHSKMCNSFPANPAVASQIQQETIESINFTLKGIKMKYNAPFHPSNKQGKGVGKLIGGNLRTLENMAGSNAQINTKNCILFLEDTGEYPYSVDRMLWNLKRAGLFNQLQGLIIGGFKNKLETEEDLFPLSLQQMVHEKITEFEFPVCFDFPVGHQVNNFALKCGVIHQLEVSENGTILVEI